MWLSHNMFIVEQIWSKWQMGPFASIDPKCLVLFFCQDHVSARLFLDISIISELLSECLEDLKLGAFLYFSHGLGGTDRAIF